MLYFHPWEFDLEQAKLPLRRLSRFRTYHGVAASRGRLDRLLGGRDFVRAIDAVETLRPRFASLPCFSLGGRCGLIRNVNRGVNIC
jgi:hypothetical protein